MLAQKCREMREYRGTLENAIHMVDLLRLVMRTPKRVSAAALFDDPYCESLCTAQIEFEEGGIGLLGASREAGEWHKRIEIFGGGKTALIQMPDSLKITDSEISPTKVPSIHYGHDKVR